MKYEWWLVIRLPELEPNTYLKTSISFFEKYKRTLWPFLEDLFNKEKYIHNIILLDKLSDICYKPGPKNIVSKTIHKPLDCEIENFIYGVK